MVGTACETLIQRLLSAVRAERNFKTNKPAKSISTFIRGVEQMEDPKTIDSQGTLPQNSTQNPLGLR